MEGPLILMGYSLAQTVLLLRVQTVLPSDPSSATAQTVCSSHQQPVELVLETASLVPCALLRYNWCLGIHLTCDVFHAVGVALMLV